LAEVTAPILFCSCGAAIKKDYSPPLFTYRDFLRVEEPVLAEHQDAPED